MTSITVKVTKTDAGFMGQCTKNPQIVVNTKKKSQIEEKVKAAISGYVTAFPGEKNKILPQGSLDFKVNLK